MITFHKMEMADVCQVAELEKELFSDAWSESGIKETLQQKNSFCLIAKDASGVCGYLLVYYVLDECEIARIGVSPNMRRQGVAASLIRELEKFCHENGIVQILLDVRESNDGARGFYQYCGFAEDGIRKNFYTNPKENAVLMSRVLTVQ